MSVADKRPEMYIYIDNKKSYRWTHVAATGDVRSGETPLEVGHTLSLPEMILKCYEQASRAWGYEVLNCHTNLSMEI